MDSKKNMVLLGVIVALIGVLTFFINFTDISIFYLMLFAAGAAMLLLYRTKRKSWSLILGGYLTYFGVSNIISSLTGVQLSGYALVAMFFIVPGLIFFVLYFDKNKKGLLIPGAVLLWLGLYFSLRDIELPFSLLNNFCFYMAAAFLTIFLFSRTYLGKWPLYVAVTLLAIGVFELIASLSTSIFFLNYRFLGPGAIVLAGIVIMIFALRKDCKDRGENQ